MKELTDRQSEVLRAMIESLKETRVCPTIYRICELTGLPRNQVQGTLRGLKRWGYVIQPYRHGAYRPLFTPDAAEVKVVVAVCPKLSVVPPAA